MNDMASLLRATIASAGWASAPIGDPRSGDAYLGLLRALYTVGRRDLPLGRLLEGHVDAVQIVLRYGDAAQADRLRAAVASGAMLGVWNAALPDAPLRGDGLRLNGGKSYASGAGVLSHALVSSDMPEASRLVLVDLGRTPPAIDRSWWRTTGMARSETHQVRWVDAAYDAADLIGAPGDYAREPWFSGGALRFVAVHAGGIAALFDHARDHLVGAGRAGDPFQAARLAELYALAGAAAGTVRDAARFWFENEGEARLARVAAARLAVTDLGERAIVLAQQAVGLQGQFLAHPLAAVLTDLAVYLRQPAPDAQRLRVGRAVAAGMLTPDL